MAGTVFWITGLSGAGKTTVGNAVFKKLKQKKDNVVMLDGDALRKAISSDLGYSSEDRHESARRNIRLCKLLADQEIDVVCCTICMFEDIRQWNRANNERYFEVYLKTPMGILQERNQKSLYTDSKDKVVGIGIGMEEPKHPDVVFVNDGTCTPDDIADKIILRAKEKGL